MAQSTNSTTLGAPVPRASILSFPTEIICELPQYFNDLDDLYAFLKTCRLFNNACACTPVKLPMSKAMDKRFVIAGSARQLSDWAAQSKDHKDWLHEAIQKRDDSLLKLSFEVCRFGLKEIRALHEEQENIVKPLATKLRGDCIKCENTKWHQKHCLNIETALWDFVAYCNLFRHDIASNFSEASAQLAVGFDIRQRWTWTYLRGANEYSKSRPSGMNRRQLGLINMFKCHQFQQEANTAAQIFLTQQLPSGSMNKWKREKYIIHMQHQGMATLEAILHGGWISLAGQSRVQEIFNDVYHQATQDRRTDANLARDRRIRWVPLFGRHTELENHQFSFEFDRIPA